MFKNTNIEVLEHFQHNFFFAFYEVCVTQNFDLGGTFLGIDNFASSKENFRNYIFCILARFL